MWLLSLCKHFSRSSASENLEVLCLQGLTRLRGALLHTPHSHWLYKMSGGYVEMRLQTTEKHKADLCDSYTNGRHFYLFCSLLFLCKYVVCVPRGEICKRKLLEQWLGLSYSSLCQHFEACKAVLWTQQGPCAGLDTAVPKFSSWELECLFSVHFSVRGLRTIIAFKDTQRL